MTSFYDLIIYISKWDFLLYYIDLIKVKTLQMPSYKIRKHNDGDVLNRCLFCRQL
jgi:hypothetical protein